MVREFFLAILGYLVIWDNSEVKLEAINASLYRDIAILIFNELLLLSTEEITLLARRLCVLNLHQIYVLNHQLIWKL